MTHRTESDAPSQPSDYIVRCSFCLRRKFDGPLPKGLRDWRMITAPTNDVHICEPCVRASAKILDAADGQPRAPDTAPDALRRRIVAELNRMTREMGNNREIANGGPSRIIADTASRIAALATASAPGTGMGDNMTYAAALQWLDDRINGTGPFGASGTTLPRDEREVENG